MPQLNPEFFASQIFWLAITFIGLYLLMTFLAVPKVRSVLDSRDGRISGDLDLAERLRKDAEKARHDYETALAEARAKSQAIAAKSRADMAVEGDKRKADLASALASQTQAAEANIAAAKAQALQSLRDVSAEACSAILTRVGGVEASSQAVLAAVDAELAQGARS